MLRVGLIAALCLLSAFACGRSERSLISTELERADDFDKHELAARFAPIVRLHPQELYLPMDPDAFLIRDASSRNEDFFLSARADYLKGHQARTIVNVSEDGRKLQYWIFYAKNGCQGAKLRFRISGPIKIWNISETNRTLELCNVAIHEGDWENITLRLSNDRSRVESAYLSSHGVGNWLPASALESKNNRPFVYAALNSHAFYAKDIGFQADTTIAHVALDGILGIEWMQIGDIISEQAYVQKNPIGGQKLIEYDTQKALLLYEDIQKSSFKNFGDNWGRPVNAKDVSDLPDLAPGPIEWILRVAINIALQVVPELKNQSNGRAPESPWIRSGWFAFDGDKSFGSSGISFEPSVGGSGGKVFSDYKRLKKFGFYQLKEIVIHSGDRVSQVCLTLVGIGDLCHGKGGSSENRLVLDNGEFIAKQEIALGKKDGDQRVFAIRFTTNLGRSIEGGTWTSEPVTHSAPKGMQIVGWFGSSGDEIDKLGPLYGTVSN